MHIKEIPNLAEQRKINIFEYTCEDLATVLKDRYNKGAWHARAMIREVLKSGNRNFEMADEFKSSPSLTAHLKNDLIIPDININRTETEEGTTRFIMRTDDGLLSESVIIPMQSHNTLCISCQIGCRMGCRFCETGSMGLKRNLSASEIVSQVFAARFILGRNIKNLVFMGMGEPFDNFTEVSRAISVLNDQRGFDIARSHMTISTAGILPGIENFAKSEFKNIHLAISLNAPDDRTRDYLMPVNKKYPMGLLKKTLLEFKLPPRGVFLIGYVLIPGINDSEEQASVLADFLSGLPARLNLIPLNKTSVFNHDTAKDADLHRFAGYLEKRGIFVIKRWSRGSRLNAACGQLGTGSTVQVNEVHL